MPQTHVPEAGGEEEKERAHGKGGDGEERQEGADLVAADSLVLLRGGGPVEWAAELARRREQIGASYVLVSAEYMAAMAPVVADLTGS